MTHYLVKSDPNPGLAGLFRFVEKSDAVELPGGNCAT
jgi:hypothetical protein